MKKNYLMSALIALVAVACSVEEADQNIQPDAKGLAVSASVEQPGDGTKTSLDGLNVKWSVGDRIYLTDGTNCAIYEAESAALSTSFKYVSGAEELTGEVYAYYPAENVTGFNDGTFTATIPAVQPYVAGGFADGINPMTAKATVDEGSLSLNFKNLMSYVKLPIADSNADGKVLISMSLSSPSASLCGTATVTVGDEGVASMSLIGSNTVEVRGIASVLSSDAVPVYVAVPALELGKLQVTSMTDESHEYYSQSKTAANSLKALRSKIYTYNTVELGAFTDKDALVKSTAANCYMIDAASQSYVIIPLSQAIAGWDRIKSIEPSNTFDKTKITYGTRSIKSRWLDNADGTIEMLYINDQDLMLSLNGCSNGSNAVVDLKNFEEDEVVAWSWHLWFTDYKPGTDQEHTTGGTVCTTTSPAFQEGGLYYGKVLMDRNLGATATGVSGAIPQPSSKTAAQSFYGLFYQFGRKDPFATSGEVTSVNRSNITTYAYAAQNPGTFIKGTGAWSYTDANSSYVTDPWNSDGTKSEFDPCPDGWRLPKNSVESTELVYSGMGKDSFVSGNNTGNLWCGMWIPAAGYRGPVDAERASINSYYYTFSTVPISAGKAYMFYSCSTGATVFTGSSATANSRAYGLTLRCVEE